MDENQSQESNALESVPVPETSEQIQQETNQAPSFETESKDDSLPEELKSCFEDKKVAIFFTQWINSGLNASKAYQTLHPTVTRNSAKVLGSKELTKINLSTILSAYGISIEKYMDRLLDGLGATQWNPVAKDYETDYKTRLEYLKVLGKLLQLDKEKTELNVTFASTPQQDKLYQTNGNKALFRTPEHLALEILLRVKEDGQITEQDEAKLQELLEKYPEYQEMYHEVERRCPRPLQEQATIANGG